MKRLFSMTSKKKFPLDTLQSQRFIETARELECNESLEAFDEKMKKLMTVKPEDLPEEKTESSEN